jgi:hypothetical protein
MKRDRSPNSPSPAVQSFLKIKPLEFVQQRRSNTKSALRVVGKDRVVINLMDK